jgi:hypothetical protein
VGAASPSHAFAECARPQDHASWLTTNVHPGGDAFFWLGQPPGGPAPTQLEVNSGRAVSRLPIAWVVPGVARIRIPPSASGTLCVTIPSRLDVEGTTSDITLAAGPPPARIVPPPASCRLERGYRGGRPVSTNVRFAAAPARVRHVIARWETFGSSSEISEGSMAAALYSSGRCGASPPHAGPPSARTLVEVAFLDDVGNLSAFSRAVMPG